MWAPGTLELPVIDKNGYSYDVVFTPETVTASSDVTNSLPGETVLTVTLPAALDVTNTTPSRSAPVPGVRFYPLWATGSPLCELNLQRSYPDDGSGGLYCSVNGLSYSTGGGLGGGQLAAGQSLDANTLVVSASGTRSAQFTIPESDLATYEEELQKPVAWLASMYETGAADGGNVTSGDYCISDTKYVVVWSSQDVGCSGSPAFIQAQFA